MLLAAKKAISNPSLVLPNTSEHLLKGQGIVDVPRDVSDSAWQAGRAGDGRGSGQLATLLEPVR